MCGAMSKDTAQRVVALADGGTGAIADRRRSARRPAGLRGRLTYPPAPAEAAQAEARPGAADVTVADWSQHGVGLVSPVPVAVGSTPRAVIFREGTYDLRADLRVVSCRRRQDGMYAVGAEIV
jgi:hypothetical protein